MGENLAVKHPQLDGMEEFMKEPFKEAPKDNLPNGKKYDPYTQISSDLQKIKTEEE